MHAGADTAAGQTAAAAQDLPCPLFDGESLYHPPAGILRPQLARFLPAPDTQDAGTYRLALDMLCYAAFCTLDSLVVSRTPLNVETFARNMRALFVTMRQAS